MKKTKLVYVLHDIQIGGVEVALVSALPKLCSHYDLTVIALGKVDPGMIRHLSEEQRLCIRAFDYPLISYPIFIFKIAFHILSLRPDLLICSLWRASLVGVLVKKLRPGLKFISFVHSTTFFHRCDAFFTKAAIRHANHVFTDSTATSKFVESRFRNGPATTAISFFINKSPQQKINPPLDGQTVRFMFLGRLSKVKNLSLTVDAMHFLHSRGLNVTLDLYGPDDGELDGLLKHITGSGLQSIVHYRGKINADRKAAAFREHHFLIQLSTNEGMAMSVAEAMQHGLVCFTTPVGEIKNYAEDMHTAIFASIENKNAFENSLLKIESIAQNPERYDEISDHAFCHFQKVKTYSDSLSQAISLHTNFDENTTRHHAG